MLKDNLVFFSECFRNFKTTGSFWPTSRKAALNLCSPLKNVKGARHILEIGPGTGSVTVVLLEQMTEQDTLTVCEINPRLMACLKARLANNENYKKHADRVHFFLGAVQDMAENITFNAIVCAVPFNNFDAALTKEIFDKAERLAEDGALMSYYEYIILGDAVKLSPSQEQRKRIRGVTRYIKKEWMPYVVSKKSIWKNMLPIYVYTINLTAARASREETKIAC